jgi:hypothetical protein
MPPNHFVKTKNIAILKKKKKSEEMAYVKTQNSLKWLNFNSLLNLKVAGTRGRKSKWDLELSPRVSNFMS